MNVKVKTLNKHDNYEKICTSRFLTYSYYIVNEAQNLSIIKIIVIFIWVLNLSAVRII